MPCRKSPMSASPPLFMRNAAACVCWLALLLAGFFLKATEAISASQQTEPGVSSSLSVTAEPLGICLKRQFLLERSQGGLTRKVDRLMQSLPDQHDFGIVREEAMLHFESIQKLWLQEVGAPRFRTLLDRIASGEVKELTTEHLDLLKELRSSTKQLHELYRALDESHSVPQDFHDFDIQLGRLKDFVEDGISGKPSGRLRKRAVRVKELQSAVLASDGPIKNGLLRLASSEEISRFLNGQLEEIKALSRAVVPLRDFHEIRKALRRIRIFFQMLEMQSGGPARDASRFIRAYLGDLIAEMEDIHRPWVREARIKRKVEYDDVMIPFDPDIQKKIEFFVKMMGGGGPAP
jgi:hypothetical protein